MQQVPCLLATSTECDGAGAKGLSGRSGMVPGGRGRVSRGARPGWPAGRPAWDSLSGPHADRIAEPMTAWMAAAGDRTFLQTYKTHTKTSDKFVYDFNEIVSLSEIQFHLTNFFLQLMTAIDHSHHSYHMQCPIKPVAGISWRERGGDVYLWYQIRMIVL